MGDRTHPETLTFQTEVQQLLHLMIHSLYSHKEVFLRELISNASDACDRLRFESLTHDELMEDDAELAIRVSFDPAARTLTIADNGIGMSREEVIEHIGTIARSGTKQFMSALSGDQKKDASLIGQFGVGFYSVFMVADRVTLTTRRAGLKPELGVRWESDGQGAYTVADVAQPGRGTAIVLHLRADADEFLEPARLRGIVTRYSDHVSLPIRMPKEAPGAEPEWETINRGAALWARPKKDISQEEYTSFYANLAYDPEPPLATIHHRVEGTLEYILLLFIPARAPFDLWDREHRHGVKLYVRRIFIADDTKHLVPAYLRFVRGVIDSADLPLNVSREFLQHNTEIDKIRAGAAKRILGELKTVAEKEPEKYAGFWKEFGRALKEGIIEDPENRATLADLLRFASTREDSAEQGVSLAQYLGRMPLKQKAIYYLTAESHTTAKSSPHLELFRKKNIEVLLLSDPVDEWLVTHLTEYQQRPLQSVARGGLDLSGFEDETAAAKQKEIAGAFGELTQALKEALGDKVKDVRISRRLTDSPACLVADEHDPGVNLERMLKALGQKASGAKPILEINPEHALIAALKTERAQFADWAQVLFDQAALAEGAQLEEPAAYVQRVNALLGAALAKK